MADDAALLLSTIPPENFMTREFESLAQALSDQFRDMSLDGIGICWKTYGASEIQAMQMIERLAKQYGFETHWDTAQNLTVRLQGSELDTTAVATGSHLDSVPQCGHYDGAAGVIGRLIALFAAEDLGGLICPIEFLALRGEESACFGGPCYFGSRTMFGQLNSADLASQHRDNGLSLAEQMRACSVDLAKIEAQDVIRNTDEMHSPLEIHIEQGPVLIARDKPVDLVTGIRGNVRHRRVVCRGHAAHLGAVQRWLRHNSVVAIAELLMRIDEHWHFCAIRMRTDVSQAQRDI